MITKTRDTDLATRYAGVIMLNLAVVTTSRRDEAYQIFMLRFPDLDARHAVRTNTPREIVFESQDDDLLAEIWVPHAAGDVLGILERPYRVKATTETGGSWVKAFDCPAIAARYMYQAQFKCYCKAVATAPGPKGRRWITRQGLNRLYKTQKA